MILVTGAAGKTGQAVIRALVARGAKVRAFVRREAYEASLMALGAAEVVVGEFLDDIAIRQAMQGVRAIYHIAPNVHPQEVEIAQHLLLAAREAGVERFVYHSVLHPQIEAMPHHWLKMRVEELIFTSGLAYTILQPCAYMQNILGLWESIVEDGVLPVPYNLAARMSMVDLQDVAEVAAIVLTEPSFENAIFELAGREPLSQLEVAAVLSEALGRDVVAERTPLLLWQESARQVGLSDYAIDTLSKMFLYYDEVGLVGNGKELEMLLGREPNDFRTFVSGLI